MPARSYKHDYFCRICRTYYKKEECPMHQSKKQKYPTCPKCPTKYKLRVSAHNKGWKDYIQKTTLENIPILSKPRI